MFANGSPPAPFAHPPIQRLQKARCIRKIYLFFTFALPLFVFLSFLPRHRAKTTSIHCQKVRDFEIFFCAFFFIPVFRFSFVLTYLMLVRETRVFGKGVSIRFVGGNSVEAQGRESRTLLCMHGLTGDFFPGPMSSANLFIAR